MCSYHFISILLVLMHKVYEVSDVAIARNYLILGLFKQKSQWVHLYPVLLPHPYGHWRSFSYILINYVTTT